MGAGAAVASYLNVSEPLLAAIFKDELRRGIPEEVEDLADTESIPFGSYCQSASMPFRAMGSITGVYQSRFLDLLD